MTNVGQRELGHQLRDLARAQFVDGCAGVSKRRK